MKQNQTNSFALGFAFVLMFALGILIGVLIQPAQPGTTCVFSKASIGGEVGSVSMSSVPNPLSHSSVFKEKGVLNEPF